MSSRTPIPAPVLRRLQLQFLVLETLSLGASVAGLLLGVRPLLWVGGVLGSLAMWFLLRALTRKTGQPFPAMALTVAAPALVFFGLSFVMVA